jgi:hypothetical protein
MLIIALNIKRKSLEAIICKLAEKYQHYLLSRIVAYCEGNVFISLIYLPVLADTNVSPSPLAQYVEITAVRQTFAYR